jgi:hypothetical protein
MYIFNCLFAFERISNVWTCGLIILIFFSFVESLASAFFLLIIFPSVLCVCVSLSWFSVGPSGVTQFSSPSPSQAYFFARSPMLCCFLFCCRIHFLDDDEKTTRELPAEEFWSSHHRHGGAAPMETLEHASLAEAKSLRWRSRSWYMHAKTRGKEINGARGMKLALGSWMMSIIFVLSDLPIMLVDPVVGQGKYMQLARFVFSRQNQKVSLAPKFH